MDDLEAKMIGTGFLRNGENPKNGNKNRKTKQEDRHHLSANIV